MEFEDNLEWKASSIGDEERTDPNSFFFISQFSSRSKVDEVVAMVLRSSPSRWSSPSSKSALSVVPPQPPGWFFLSCTAYVGTGLDPIFF